MNTYTSLLPLPLLLLQSGLVWDVMVLRESFFFFSLFFFFFTFRQFITLLGLSFIKIILFFKW